MSSGQGSSPLPWHRASFLADLFPQSQPHRAALEVRQKTVPLYDLLQRLRRLQRGHLRLPCSNQHRPQGHSRFPPHPPFPDILKITDREEVKYNHSPAPPSFRPVLSTSKCSGPVPDRRSGGMSSVWLRRLSVEWSGTVRSSPRSAMMEPISPSVCRKARPKTARIVSAGVIRRAE